MGYRMRMSKSKDKYHVCFGKLQKSGLEVSATSENIVKWYLLKLILQGVT